MGATTDPRQLALPGVNLAPRVKNKKKTLPRLSSWQAQALQRIAESKSKIIVGIDEVGLGAWAGPLVVAAVALPSGWDHDGVADSKRLTLLQREAGWEAVRSNAACFCVLSQPAEVIDREGIERVRRRLTECAALYCRLRFPSALVVQDGEYPIEVDGCVTRVVWLPKADVVVPAVSAASILAKLARDRFMVQMAQRFPGYSFESNVGYHSKAHVAGLRKQGPCALHRMSIGAVSAHARGVS